MSQIKKLIKHDPEEVRQILTWFARQAEEVQFDILRVKQAEHKRMACSHPRISPSTLELAALVAATKRGGWDDEQAYRTSHSISEEAARRIQQRRAARARRYLAHRDQVRSWLGKNWGKVMDMRRAGLSWRRVALMVEDEHGIRISHTALFSYWRNWNAKEE